jgi:hypothetical protein
MSAGGARPGAGRKAGKPNRLSEQRVEQARRQGKRLPPESLLLIAENSMAMAERYQPELTDPTTREKSPNPLHNEERYAFWLYSVRQCGGSIAGGRIFDPWAKIQDFFDRPVPGCRNLFGPGVYRNSFRFGWHFEISIDGRHRERRRLQFDGLDDALIARIVRSEMRLPPTSDRSSCHCPPIPRVGPSFYPWWPRVAMQARYSRSLPPE